MSFSSVGALALVAACSAGGDNSLSDDDDPNVGGGHEGGAGDGGVTFGQGGTGTGESSCFTDPSVDDDNDGFTDEEGDCNDCDPNTNPGAVEVVTDPMDPASAAADENCDGQIDEAFVTCDEGMGIDDTDPLNAARAIGLCKTSTGPGDWGVVDAAYVRADGSATTVSRAMGILADFGSNVTPRRGSAMLGLSSGFARDAGDPGACGKLSCNHNGEGTPPPGFPQDVPGCSGATDINDDVGLEVTLVAPTNASGYTFDFKFYSFEYPEFVCTLFNDQFITLVDPAPQGSINGNVTFDSMSNPVSVNIAFFEVCEGCPLGTSELEGTGFGDWNDAGATSWLVTQAPVEGGEELTIRWAIWDAGDTLWDSTALVDNFNWVADSGEPIDVNTTPIPK
ncbi:MAG: choice-of-anchor L domain-containing protein [Polyangiaceae bacterium]